MSKYTDEELGFMARRALVAKNQNDSKYVELIMRVSLKAGLRAELIEKRILDLARIGA